MTRFRILLDSQRAYFDSGATRPLAYRKIQLQKLFRSIQKREKAICEALHQDLSKHVVEAYASEVAIVYKELEYLLKNLSKWMAPRRVGTPLVLFPASSWTQAEPLGSVLVIAPWNYPFQLILSPLMGAIAAGNCVVLKPSELAPHTSAFIAALIRDTFDPEYVACVEGGVESNQALLEERFDHILFTGSGNVGRIVAAAAAKHLTPVTLELGGKSPCLIEESASLPTAARRIAWGKYFNAGQTCVAPDFVLVPNRLRSSFVDELRKSVRAFFGADPKASPDYARLVNEKHYTRVLKMIPSEGLLFGGEHDAAQKYIAPTAFLSDWSAPAMNEEIFGPLLPVIGYDSLEQSITKLTHLPKPLAFYLFSKNSHLQKEILERLSFGSACVNDTLVQISTPQLPFGGVGASGYGSYHGKHSFDRFSHYKPIMKRGTWLDIPLRYPPYLNKFKWVKRLMDF